MPTQDQVLADLERLFVFVHCECGRVYKVMVQCARSDTVEIKCPGCDLPLSSATLTEARLGVPTAMPIGG